MSAHRILPVICTDDPRKSRDFYTQLLDFSIKFDSEWCVLLASPKDPPLEIAFQRRDQAQIPEAFRGPFQGGLYLSLEVGNVDEVCERAQSLGVELLERPNRQGTDNYDRRSALFRDPNGVLLEVITPTDPEEAVQSEFMSDQ